MKALSLHVLVFKLAPVSLSGHDGLTVVVEWQNGPYPFSSLKTFRVE